MAKFDRDPVVRNCGYYSPRADYSWAAEVLQNTARCLAHASPFYVNNTQYWQQCSRRPGHGPNGSYCRQHARLLATV